VGVGGDPFIGARFKDLLEAVRHDPNTEAVVVLGEIGGSAEEELAAHIAETGFPKPVVAFVAGRTAPPGKRLGHAGAILEEGGGGIQEKMEALAGAGIAVCPDLERIPETVAGALAQS
jgi:succinyl-CoA synthetase alpha subunit